jgi:hypothetical protein
MKKAINLSDAGRHLVGPPEGYSRKKQLQVKHWLTTVPSAQDAGAPNLTPEVWHIESENT